MSAAGRQRGIALLSVLIVVFVASLSAAAISVSTQIALRRTTLQQHGLQARQYLLGAEQWAQQILYRDRQDGGDDHLEEDWAALPAVLPVEGGLLSGRLLDLQGRFNLNNLVREGQPDPVQLALLRRLLEVLELDPELSAAVVDWIDADLETTFPDGAEDDHYSLATPAYTAANQPMAAASELRLVKGIDDAAWQVLRDVVTALPATATPINVNTAPAAVLAALGPGLSLADGEALAEQRVGAPYASVEDFLADPLLADTPVTADNLAVASNYFLLRAEAEIGDSRAALAGLLHRDDNGRTRTLRRHFGREEP